jgi:hypothetical protein
MIKICKYCKKEFNGRSSSVYCSRACRNKANPNVMTKEHRRKISDSMKGKNLGEKNGMYSKKGKLSPTYGTKRTDECKKRLSEMKIGLYNGENNPNWKGGISDYPYPEYWTKELKTKIRKRDNFVCQICGCVGYQVHHIDYDKDNCSENNLITLCRSCHSKTNFNRNYWKKLLSEHMLIKDKKYEKN